MCGECHKTTIIIANITINKECVHGVECILQQLKILSFLNHLGSQVAARGKPFTMFTIRNFLIPWGSFTAFLKVIYHPLYSMNKLVTNKSKLSQDGIQLFPYMG